MNRSLSSPQRFAVSLLGLLAAGLPGAIATLPLPVRAQSLTPCPEAQPGEYLLLINNPAPEERSRLEQVLPVGATVIRCQYQDTLVMQVGNFASDELARSWAEYLATVEGFETAVAPIVGAVSTPDAGSETGSDAGSEADFATNSEADSQSNASASDPAAVPATANLPLYEPTILGGGYAVLVRYFNRPELATQLQAQLNTPVGLAVYEQQPYLLARYSPDALTAGQVLQRLSDEFSVMIVDSRQVVLLSPAVSPRESRAVP